MSYAILRRNIQGVDVVIRRTIAYLFAKTTLLILLTIPFGLLTAPLLLHPDRRVRDLIDQSSLPFVAMSIVLILLAIRYRPILLAHLDQLFDRLPYPAELMMSELVNATYARVSVGALAQIASSNLERAFHPLKLLVYCKAPFERALYLHAKQGDIQAPSFLGENSKLLHFVEAQAKPFQINAELLKRATIHEADWVLHAGISVLVPTITGEGELVGAVLLGPKRSEQPYKVTDYNLLTSFAAQIAVAIESTHLREGLTLDHGSHEAIKNSVKHKKIDFVRQCVRCGACFDNTVKECTVDGCALQSLLDIPKVVDERYRLDRLVGTGGLGMVFKARDLKLDRVVAIKILKHYGFGQQEIQRRFRREAKALALISHPAIVTVHDFGTLPLGDGFIVMEYVPGISWRRELDCSARIIPSILEPRVDQLLAAMEASHDLGVAHRDLKPENILIKANQGEPGLVKIVDFGLAKVFRPDFVNPKSETHAGLFMGTPGYVAPEQARGEESGPQSDIFSLGVIILESILGRHPFRTEATRQLTFEVPEKSSYIGEAGSAWPDIDRILCRCLIPNPARRFRRIQEFRSDLISALHKVAQDQSARLV